MWFLLHSATVQAQEAAQKKKGLAQMAGAQTVGVFGIPE